MSARGGVGKKMRPTGRRIKGTGQKAYRRSARRRPAGRAGKHNPYGSMVCIRSEGIISVRGRYAPAGRTPLCLCFTPQK